MTAEPVEVASTDDEPDTGTDTEALRRIVQWVIIGGLVLAAAAAAFLVWETWHANEAAKAANLADRDHRIYNFGPPEPAAPPADPSPGPDDIATSDPGSPTV